GSGAHDAPYAFTTQHPSPGMIPYEDVHFQLIDMPAVSAEHPLPWLATTLQTADAALLVVDLCEPACVEQLEDVHATLRAKGITLTERWSVSDNASRNEYASDDDPFAMRLPTLILANKSDRVSDPEAELVALCELAPLRSPTMTGSACTGPGLGELGPWPLPQLGFARVCARAS